MKRIALLISSGAIFALPLLASAQGIATDDTAGPFGVLLNNILAFINTYLIPFIIGLGFLVFVWGMFQYFIAGGANDDAKEKGKNLMIYATLGFVLIIVLWGVVRLIAESTGVQDQNITNLVPRVDPSRE